jgi:RNA polymerase sigma factor (sigma-70 family)
MNDSDLTLLTRWRDGDRRAADELSRRYQGDLRQFFRTKAGPEDVEDLVQKVWLGLIETQGPQREAVVPTSFKAYLFGIARHVVIRHIEARYRLDNTVPIEQSIASLDPSLSQVVGERLKSQRLIRALQTLPVEMQILLELRYYTELSTAGLPPRRREAGRLHAPEPPGAAAADGGPGPERHAPARARRAHRRLGEPRLPGLPGARPGAVPRGPRQRDEGYALLLQLVFEELATELPGLYGPAGVADLVPIPAATLRHVVDTLDDAALESCWTDDMTLGWVYQYWNDPEREALDAKLNDGGKVEPHEIASKTQMFTERYMVDWLLQNSLGPMWLAMCQKHGWTPEVEADGTLAALERRTARAQ